MMDRRYRSRSLWLLAALLLGAARAWAQVEIGTVAAVQGALQVQRAATWQNGTVGAPIFVGDRLRTGARDAAKIVFRDDSVLDIAPQTDLTVDEQAFDVNAHRFDTLLGVVKGKVRAWVSEYYRQPRARYEIETPTAIAGVRGTEFVVLYDPSGEVTDVVGLAETVDVAGKLGVLGAGVEVGPRLLSRVEKGRFPTTPQQLDDTQLAHYLSGLEIIGTGRPNGLNVQHAAASGRLLAPQDVPAAVVQPAAAGAVRPSTPFGFLADRLSPDIATNTQPLLDYQNTPPGVVPVGGVQVGF
jgi:hypothetical protein